MSPEGWWRECTCTSAINRMLVASDRDFLWNQVRWFLFLIFFSCRLAPSRNWNPCHQQLLPHMFPASLSSFGSDWTKLREDFSSSGVGLWPARAAGTGVGLCVGVARASSEGSQACTSVWGKEHSPDEGPSLMEEEMGTGQTQHCAPTQPTGGT